MRHHYVPEFLQKPWTKNALDGKLEVFRLDLPNAPSSRHTPKHTGFDNDLYALTKDVVAGMDKQSVEKLFLKNVDNNAALVRNKLEHQGLKYLSLEDKVHWTRFIMSLRFRQPDAVHLLQQSATENLKESLSENPEEFEELISTDGPQSLKELTEKEYPLYGNKILNMNWWLWDFHNVPYDLLLSDHPCVFTSGIDDPNCIIALPISPKKAFMATQSDEVAKTLRRVQPKTLIMLINESIFMQARTRIYARNQFRTRRFIENRMYKREIR
jgi:hypothetical protein